MNNNKGSFYTRESTSPRDLEMLWAQSMHIKSKESELLKENAILKQRLEILSEELESLKESFSYEKAMHE